LLLAAEIVNGTETPLVHSLGRLSFPDAPVTLIWGLWRVPVILTVTWLMSSSPDAKTVKVEKEFDAPVKERVALIELSLETVIDPVKASDPVPKSGKLALTPAFVMLVSQVGAPEAG